VRLGAVGGATLFLSIGLGRFSYTTLLPALIAEGHVSAVQGGYVGASNLLGFLLGALAAPVLMRGGRASATVRAFLAVSVASLAACAIPLGFVWLMAWRLAIGIAAGVLIVGAVSMLLGTAPAGRIGRVAGLIFMGPGTGILVSGSVLPILLDHGVVVAWLGLAAMGLVVAGLAWAGWPPDSDAGRGRTGGPVMPALLSGDRHGRNAFYRLLAAHALFGAAIMPHTIYWGDFIARGLGLGVPAAGAFWAAAGLAAMAGPMLIGFAADRAGFAPTLFAGLLCLALGLLLPAASGGIAAIALSTVLFGAFCTGMSTLMSGRTRTLVPAADLPGAWSRMAVAVSIGQAGGGYTVATVFAATGRFDAVFLSGMAAALVAALLCMPPRDRAGSHAPA
jgi:predicted MFS family arabinose efflux permease